MRPSCHSALALAAALLALACSGGEKSVNPPPCVVASISASAPALSLVEGQSSQLSATVAATGCTTLPSTSWESSNPAVATVDASGTVKGVAPGGPITITARAAQASATVAVTVAARTVASLTLLQPPTQGAIGSPLALIPQAKDQLGNVMAAEVTWSVSNARVAVTAPGSAWTTCANEGGTCANAGTSLVRYGADSSFRYLVATGPVACGLAAFGDDPLPNVLKSCARADLLKSSATTSLFPVGAGTTTVRARAANGVEASTVVTIQGGSVFRWFTRCPSCTGGAASIAAGTTHGVWPIALDSVGNTLLVPAQASSSAPSIAGIPAFIAGLQFSMRGVAPGSATLTFSPAAGYTGASATLPVTVTPVQTIGSMLAADTSYSMFMTALTRIGERAVLDSAFGTFTVFAPNNLAFLASGLTPSVFDRLSVTTLRGIVHYHIAVERVAGSDIPSTFPNRRLATLLPGASATSPATSVYVGRNGGSTYVNYRRVSALDVMATANGVVHRISGVLFTQNFETLGPGICSDTQLSLFCALIARADVGQPSDSSRIDALLRNDAVDVTVFVPNDAAMTAAVEILNGAPLPSGVTAAQYIQNTLPVATARRIAQFHILPVRAYSVNLPLVSTNVPTLLGSSPGLLVDRSTALPRLSGPGNNGSFANFLGTDREAANGTWHMIDRVLLPQ